MYTPAQIQLKTVKTVAIEPESAVPPMQKPEAWAEMVQFPRVARLSPYLQQPQIGHNAGFQAPTRHPNQHGHQGEVTATRGVWGLRGGAEKCARNGPNDES